MVIIVSINLLTNQEHLFLVGMHLEEGKRINIPFRTHKFKLNDNFLHRTGSSKETVSPEGLLGTSELPYQDQKVSSSMYVSVT